MFAEISWNSFRGRYLLSTVLCRRYYKKQDEMIATYERACDGDRVKTTESGASAHRRQSNRLAIASFVCNLVCSSATCVLIHIVI